MTPKHTIILAVAIACMCLSAPTRVVGQTEKFDIVHYTPPAKWKKTSQESKVVYSTVDESKSSFCIITIYASTNSFGSPEKDFKNHWDALVVQPYKADANPRADTQTNGDGWIAIASAAQAEENGNKFYIFLVY